LSEIDQKVKDMAKLAIYSNRISEIHEKNLMTWPFVFFEGVRSVKIDYDLSRTDSVDLDKLNNLTVNKPTNQSFVKYFLTIDEKIENHHLDKRFSALVKAVRDIFWKNITVEIAFNDKVVHKSEANVGR
jgi:hypothetical protein